MTKNVFSGSSATRIQPIIKKYYLLDLLSLLLSTSILGLVGPRFSRKGFCSTVWW
jgi:hypothetical protein